MLKKILISSIVLNIGVLLGRLSGFVRESFVASAYGVGSDADIVILMLSVPDILVNILMGGALGAVLIPEFMQMPEKSKKLLFQSIIFFGIIFLALSFFLYLKMDVLISLLAPGFGPLQAAKAAQAIQWVIWLVPLTVMAGATTAFLQSKNQYAIPAMGTIIVNGFIIFGLILIRQGWGGIYVLSCFVLLGGFLRLITQVVRIENKSFEPIRSIKPFLINKMLMNRYLQAVASSSILLFFPVIARALATYQGEGNISILNYATKLIEFPMALTVTFLSVVLLPRLSQSYIDDKDLHEKIVKYGIQITLVLSMLSASTLSAVSESYASFVFGYGKIDLENIVSISELAAIGMLLLPLMGISTYITAVFNSRKNTHTPLIINLFGLLFFVVVYKLGFFGYSLKSIMLAMIASYVLISMSLLMALGSKKLPTIKICFFNKVIFGTLISSIILHKICLVVQGGGLLSGVTILISGIIAAFVLIIVALLSDEIRSILMVKIKNL